MILKKLIIGISFNIFLSGCAQNAALIRASLHVGYTGNAYHAGLTLWSNEIITKTTGKSTLKIL